MAIEELRGRIYRIGANDSEMSAIDEIIKQLNASRISADIAIAKVQEILEAKQDYH